MLVLQYIVVYLFNAIKESNYNMPPIQILNLMVRVMQVYFNFKYVSLHFVGLPVVESHSNTLSLFVQLSQVIPLGKYVSLHFVGLPVV